MEFVVYIEILDKDSLIPVSGGKRAVIKRDGFNALADWAFTYLYYECRIAKSPEYKVLEKDEDRGYKKAIVPFNAVQSLYITMMDRKWDAVKDDYYVGKLNLHSVHDSYTANQIDSFLANLKTILDDFDCNKHSLVFGRGYENYEDMFNKQSGTGYCVKVQ